MIGYLIKNNFKLMYRSWLNIILFIAAPTIVAAVLISAFTRLMDTYKAPDNFEVGYRIESGSIFENYIDELADGLEDEGITLVKQEKGDPAELISDLELGGFVELNKDNYVVYKSDDAKAEGLIIDYVLGETLDSFIPKTVKVEEITVEHPKFVPAINSTDYYGIIEIAYFAWCGIVCGAGVFSAEKKYRIDKRFEVTGIPEWKLYFAKLIPIVAAVSLGLLISTVIGIVFLDVHWGNAFLSAAIMFCMIIAAAALEMIIYSATRSMVATIVISFSFVWFCGFFGGSFETYMFASHPESIKELSPLYYGNRALVELSCMGQSDYASKSIIISSAIAAISSVINILIGNFRRGRA